MSRRSKPSRPYRLRARAESMEATRRRIAKAAFELHGSIGPAQTTIAAVAERAGVERATVYRHFPDDLSLFRACVGHGMAAHPFPDPAEWERLRDPAERLETGLTRLYAFYRGTEGIWANVLRDLPGMPVFQQANAEAGVFAFFDRVREGLSATWNVRGRNRGEKRAVVAAGVGHAVQFETWRSLARVHGLGDDQAVRAMVTWIRCLAS